ncbi:MAG: hypothetical protein K9K78_02545, partial [Spirochaetales bacterium]|nr:hypothetical protein [Spirochaetales bacterium]
NFEGEVKGGARAAETPKSAKVTEALSNYYADDAVWEIFHPFNTLRGSTEAAEQFRQLLLPPFLAFTSQLQTPQPSPYRLNRVFPVHHT